MRRFQASGNFFYFLFFNQSFRNYLNNKMAIFCINYIIFLLLSKLMCNLNSVKNESAIHFTVYTISIS